MAICVHGSAVCFLVNKLSEGISDTISRSHPYVKKTRSAHVANYKQLLLTRANSPAGVKFHVCYEVCNHASITDVNQVHISGLL
jgi:hypothetical protein